MKEVFKAIQGYEGLYEVSNLGNIKSLKRSYRKKEKLLKPQKWSKGYLWVCLCKNNSHSRLSISRLVANTFIPNIENKPQVNHINGNKADNNLYNLEWNTQSENINHAISMGLKKFFKGEEHISAKLKNEDVINIRQIYKTNNYSQREIAVIYGVSRSCISHILDKSRWGHL